MKFLTFGEIMLRLKAPGHERFFQSTLLEANLSVTNTYNRNNVFYVNLITSDVARQLPILPSLGLTFSF